MNELQFCYWLQGFFEMSKPYSINKDQTEEIKNHLDLVFKKVTPVVNFETPSPFNLNTTHTGASAVAYC